MEYVYTIFATMFGATVGTFSGNRIGHWLARRRVAKMNADEAWARIRERATFEKRVSDEFDRQRKARAN